MKEKLKELLKNSDNALEKYVIEDILDQDEPESYIKDVIQHGCQSGMVSALIYYTDTKAFFVEYIEEIDELREEMEDSLGEPLKIGMPMSNWLAWFGFEEMVRRIASTSSTCAVFCYI